MVLDHFLILLHALFNLIKCNSCINSIPPTISIIAITIVLFRFDKSRPELMYSNIDGYSEEMKEKIPISIIISITNVCISIDSLVTVK